MYTLFHYIFHTPTYLHLLFNQVSSAFNTVHYRVLLSVFELLDSDIFKKHGTHHHVIVKLVTLNHNVAICLREPLEKSSFFF